MIIKFFKISGPDINCQKLPLWLDKTLLYGLFLVGYVYALIAFSLQVFALGDGLLPCTGITVIKTIVISVHIDIIRNSVCRILKYFLTDYSAYEHVYKLYHTRIALGFCHHFG